MTKTSNKSKNDETKKEKLSINTVFTVLAALLGTLITAYVTYVIGTREPQQLPTPSPQPPPTATLVQDSVDWQSLLAISEEPYGCGSGAFIPEYLFSGQDKISWIENNYPNDTLDNSMYTPGIFYDAHDHVALNYPITNTAMDNSWLYIEKEISISIQRIKDAPPLVDSVMGGGCGGVGDFREFSTTPLKSDFPEYTVRSSTQDSADYYKLAPGEFEIFALDFECQSPGIYSASLNIPVKYKNKNGNVSFAGTSNIVCPQKINYYWLNSMGEPVVQGNAKVMNVETFIWSNSNYEPVSP